MLAASFQDCVLIDVAAQVVPEIEVVFLDTQYHFAETLWYVEQVRERYDLNLRVMHAAGRARRPLAASTPTSAARCARSSRSRARSRARPAWMSGLRRDEAPTRANTPIVDLDVGRGIVKVNPIATWTDDDIDGYIARPRPARCTRSRDRGYPSIGCWPCTRPVGDGEDPRAGRWAGTGKTECGLHAWPGSTLTASRLSPVARDASGHAHCHMHG